MTGALYRLGKLCVRHRLAVLLAWLVIAVGLIALAGVLGSQASDNISLPGTGSQQVTDLLQRGFPDQANGSSPIVLRAPAGAKITDSRYSTPINDTVDGLKQDEFVAKVISPFDRAGAAQISRDGTIAYISVFPNRSLGDVTIEDGQAILDKADPAKAAGLSTSAGGPLGQKLSKPETEQSEVVGLAMALVVLAFTFGSFVAMGLPIASALVGVLAGVSGITLLSHVTEVPTTAPTMAIMLGLGVGIDYALFIVTAQRDTLSRGMDPGESVARAVATSGGAVLFAGSTVVVAVCSLAVAGIPLVTTLGLTTGLMVAIAIVCALTLLPAILALVGPRINHLPLPGRRPDEAVDVEHNRWARLARWITHHPVIAVVGALAILIPLTIPAFSLEFGQADTGALPKEETARQAYDDITTGFGVGANGPIVFAARLARPAQPDDPQLASLQQAISRVDGVEAVTPVTLDDPGQIATFNAIPTTAPSDFATQDLVNELRDSTIPEETRGEDRRLRRRLDGRLDRPRRGDLRQAAGDDPRDHRLELHPADHRLPLAADPAEGGRLQPALDRRRLWRRRDGLPVRLVRGGGRARRRGADRQLPAAVDVRRPVRALDGLRGLSDEPRAGALQGGPLDARRDRRRPRRERA